MDIFRLETKFGDEMRGPFTSVMENYNLAWNMEVALTGFEPANLPAPQADGLDDKVHHCADEFGDWIDGCEFTNNRIGCPSLEVLAAWFTPDWVKWLADEWNFQLAVIEVPEEYVWMSTSGLQCAYDPDHILNTTHFPAYEYMSKHLGVEDKE